MNMEYWKWYCTNVNNNLYEIWVHDLNRDIWWCKKIVTKRGKSYLNEQDPYYKHRPYTGKNFTLMSKENVFLELL